MKNVVRFICSCVWLIGHSINEKAHKFFWDKGFF